MQRFIPMMVLVTMVACTSKAERERRQLAAMIEQAKADAAAESTFVQDSMKVAASITVDTVEFSRDSVMLDTSDSSAGATRRVLHVYRLFTRDRAVCSVDSVRYANTEKGDTLSCQWGPPK